MSAAQERMVTIFGGAKCREGDHEYAQAIQVGALLAESGFTICTGGYAGVMEAASRGAHERGGRVIGITMNQFKAEPNRFLTEKVPSEHFYERLQRLITRSVGYAVLKAVQTAGGFTEFAKRTRVQITRADWRKETPVNCDKAVKNPKLDLAIFPGDQIFVDRRKF